MTTRTFRAIFGVALALVLAFTLTQTWVSAQEDAQEREGVELPDESHGERSVRARRIEGVWDARVTIRRCDTGDPIINLRAMNMFIRGGTLTETGAGASPTLRGPGLGTWQHLGGRHYISVFRFFRFNPDGSFAGTQKVTRTIDLSRDANEFTATASFEVFDANDGFIRAGCATETATRLE